MNAVYAWLQAARYDDREFWRLWTRARRDATPPPPVTWTPRLRRVRRLAVFWCVVGLGLPAIGYARVVRFANRWRTPGENRRNDRLLRRAARTLAARPELIKIGVTGSYGKTSVKNILAALLRTKYRVTVSPASYNTPLGLARTVNEHLRPDSQVLIMELGARRPGEIRELCQLLRPQIGIITAVGACHLSTFGDLATIAATKAELFAALPPDGFAVTDGDNPWCAQFTHPNLTLIHQTDPFPYQTTLPGAHQQTNIKLAAAVARYLGVPEAEITAAIANLPPTPHRLEPITAANGLIILDDSYNANPASAAAALAVLATYPGKKVVQTPGFVEQGQHTAAAHAELCRQLATVADAVIVVGTTNAAWFRQYLAEWPRPVFYVPTRDAAQPLYPQLLAAGDVLLLLNDLPPTY